MSAPTRPAKVDRAVEPTAAVASVLSERHTRSTVLLLAASVGIVMTGYGIIMPVFARRLGEFGSGVEALGLMTMSFALAQFVAAPFMGTLADRFGRRPLILTALAAYVVANIGFLLAPTVTVFTAIRALEGALTAGLFPAAMGVVGDVVPDRQRAQWVGIVMGSYSAGFIFGPVIGGVLYDGWGFAAPFVASAVLAAIALAAASVLVPETHPPTARRRDALRRQRGPAEGGSIWSSLPRPLYFFGTLLALDFGGVFAFAYVEPQLVFYFYDELGWSTVRFGVVVGVYGLAMVIGQAGLGKASDRFGRQPIILVGLLLTTTFYFGVGFITSFPLMLLVALAAGLGGALMAPALSALYLDITAAQHRSRVVGIKESSASLGGVAGPLLVALLSGLITPQGIFISAGVLVLALAVLAMVGLRTPRGTAAAPPGMDGYGTRH